jgi:predicted PurR-regulated permease PerM
MERSGMQGRTAYVAIGLVLAFLLGIYFIYPIRLVTQVLLLALLLSIVISAPVDYLARRGLGRVWGTLVVFLGLFLVLQLLGLAVAPLVDQTQQLLGDFPALLAQVQDRVNRIGSDLGLGDRLYTERLLETAQDWVSGLSVSAVAGVGYSAANVLSLGVVVVLTSIYAVLQPAPLVKGFVALFPARQRQRVREILEEMYHTVQRWLLGQFTDMLILGVLTTIALWLIGIPFPLLLGVFSGLLSFVPYVGIIVSLVPPVLLALASEPTDVVWVLAAYVLIQQIEGDLVYPVVMSRAVSLHPAVIVFGLFVAGLLFGFVGFLLAVPLVAAVQVLVHELWTVRMDALGTDPNPPAQEEKPTESKRTRLWRALNTLLRRSS